MTRQAVILAGGLGTRLRTAIGDTPKALAQVGSKPVLGHQLELCRRHGFDDVLLLLGHGAETVQAYVGNGSRFGLNCHCVVEDKPLGTAGAVLAARSLLRDDFLVMYCDTMLDVDLERFWRFAESRCAAATLFAHPNDHPFDSDLIVTDDSDRILALSRWRKDGPPMRNLASAALYVVNAKALKSLQPRDSVLDFGRHVFPELIEQGATLIAYRSVEYIKDLGTPERLEKVNHDLVIGKVDPQRSGRPRPAVFLDRDGVINVERNGVLDPRDMELEPGAAEGVHLLNNAGLATVVVTNQPYISHGVLSESSLDAVHAAMEADLAQSHAFVDAVYFCPHHPHKGYAGERAALKIDCECRKPNPGMILRAVADLHLDLTNSWMIGDRTGDIKAAKRAGLRSVLVRSGHGGKDGINEAQPDYVFEDLREASTFIVSSYPAMRAWCDALVSQNLTPGTQIMIGGQARCGKSIWASVLHEAFIARGRNVVRLSLDDWLKDAAAQGDNVFERYNLEAVAKLLGQLSAACGDVEANFPVYDRAARKRLSERKIVIPRDVIVICEGVPALAVHAPRALRLTVACDDSLRRKRFDAYYTWRGEGAEMEGYWQRRQQDEVPLIDDLTSDAEILPNFQRDN